jgi:hypothetical protein
VRSEELGVFDFDRPVVRTEELGYPSNSFLIAKGFRYALDNDVERRKRRAGCA